MYKLAVFLACGVSICAAEIRTLTLREAVALALKENPDLILSRLDSRKADEAVRVARDPFIPKVVVGSGLAYSSGFPMSIEGATPSIFQARAIGSVFNRPLNYRIAAAKESRRGAQLDAAAKQDEIVYQTAAVYLEAERAARVAEVARGQIGSLEAVLASVQARVAEGRELPIETKRAELNLARGRYRTQALDSAARAAERALGSVLGLDLGDEVRIVQGDHPQPALPGSPEEAVKLALRSSREMRSLEAKMVAKGYDARAERATRWPTLDLVAQYGLLAKFNNYDTFFQKFQRHNGQLGVSFQVPLWSGPRADAAASLAEAEGAQLRIEIRTARGRIASDTLKAFDDAAQAEQARQIAQLDLDVARDQVSILLAQMQEGRADPRRVEESRAAETDKWIALYDAQTSLEKARFSLLRQTGQLVGALQ